MKWKLERLWYRGSVCALHFMKLSTFSVIITLGLSAAAFGAGEHQEIRLAARPTLSPDGEFLVFEWRGDIWRSAIGGGEATRLTSHPAVESNASISPDGETLVFSSDRGGYKQLYQRPLEGGKEVPFSFHSELTMIEDWFPDGKSVLLQTVRDGGERIPYRLHRLDISGEKPEEPLFDAVAKNGRISPDGKQILFNREGVELYRKGYHGTQASQVWLYDLEAESFSQPVESEFGCRSPLWAADGKSFFYLRGDSGVFNLHRYTFEGGKDEALTEFVDHSIILPANAREKDLLVFRNGFDFWTYDPSSDELKKLELWHHEDLPEPERSRVILSKADEVEFSPSGLEILVVAGGDIWAMDTVLKQPVNLTNTPAVDEKEISFGKDADDIWFIADDGVDAQVKRMSRKDSGVYWWRSPELEVETITDGPEVKSNLSLGPKFKRIAYVSGLGGLKVMTLKDKKVATLIESWNLGSYDWSPDGQWIAFSVQDNDFNSDIWIGSTDGEIPPRNVSRHPDFDGYPKWSPNGKKLAFIGRRFGDSTDLFYVNLTLEEETKSALDKTLKQAEDVMAKDPIYKDKKNVVKKVVDKVVKSLGGDKKEKSEEGDGKKPTEKPDQEDQKDKDSGEKEADPSKEEEKPKPPKVVRSAIDFGDIENRIHRIVLGGIQISTLNWDNKSEKLLINVRGSETVMAAAAKEDAKPSKFMDKGITIGKLTDKGVYFGVVNSVPAVIKSGKRFTYSFKIYDERDFESYQQLMFRLCWRLMRDNFYDVSMNGRDWGQILERYEEVARTAPSEQVFSRLCYMLMGELNASHTGVTLSRNWLPKWTTGRAWVPATAHLGIDFERNLEGPGLKISKVFLNGPADRNQSRLRVGETVLEIDGQAVDSKTVLPKLLNGRSGQLFRLRVANEEGEERDEIIRSISYSAARGLAKDEAIERTARMVREQSEGKYGYIHIARMMWDNFQEFERQLAASGLGKEGLVIDVRDNGGGFTTDHLLTALCQPAHAYTIPRGGGQGYPQDRIVYATWRKPIVVLCNQNSFSNAEIFTHAIRNLNRGPVVGVPTAGGVISTGQSNVYGPLSARVPFRGWFDLKTGEDMELNGAKVDFLVWGGPADETGQKDPQLLKAIEVLEQEVKKAEESKPGAPNYRNRPASWPAK